MTHRVWRAIPALHRLGDAMSNRWSAPAFIKVTGVELGLVGGMDRVSSCVTRVSHCVPR